MEINVLGPVAVVDDAAEPVDIGGPRQRRLLAALVSHANSTVSTDALIEIVFDGEPPAGATTTIRSYLARLRKALALPGDEAPGCHIVTDRAGYRLDVVPASIDATRFEASLDTARRLLDERRSIDVVEALREALDLWRGPAYGELGHEEWVRGEAARLDELRVEAEGHLIEARLACGENEDVVAELYRLVEAHPLREGFRAQLTLALHRAGRHAEALRMLDSYRTELIEVGLEPTPDLVALERSIVAHDPALQLAVPAGRALRGYRIGASLGIGRQGEVYRAVQPVIGREVAIKVIRSELADDPEFIRRFDTEARTVSKLEHAHIVPLYDYWREPSAAYMVMRLLPIRLADRLERGPLLPDDVAQMVEQLGSALSAAHRSGLVHGDIRPSNVLLDDDGNFYLSDFGLAGFTVHSKGQPIGEHGPVETMALTAPEVANGHAATPASDQYGLALLASYALTGVLPYGRDGRRTPDELPPSVHAQRPSVPLELDDVLARATAWEPDERFGSIDDVAATLVAALTGQRRRAAPSTPVNPFRGLEAFTESDSAWFFGREQIVGDVLDRMADGTPMVTLIGASGSGKSSVVRAGVVPRLRRGDVSGSADWLIATMTPGAHPVSDLRQALTSVATGASPPGASVSSMIGRTIGRDQSLLLVIDQLEELYAHSSEAERDEFVAGLTTALADRIDFRVLATLRADFHDRPLHHSEFGRMLADGEVTVVGMGVTELDRAIREPASRAGLEIEPALVSRIVADLVNQPAALPLLQFTLTELYERRSGVVLTLASYEAIGGVQAAVASRADEVFDRLSEADQATARRMFLRLVAIDDQGVATRRRVPRSELLTLGESPVDGWIEQFGAARLLTFDRDATTREPTVEIAHESLMRQWPRLRRWVLEAGEGLRIRSHLTSVTHQWAAHGHDPGDLYRGARLDAALAWSLDHGGSLTPRESEFLQASVDARASAEALEREHLEERERSHRRTRALAGVVAGALVLAIVAGFVAIAQRNDARGAAARAATRELLAASAASLTTDPELSALLAIEAARRSGDELAPEVEQALHGALLANRINGTFETGPEGFSAFSPDGRSVVTSGVDGDQAQIWFLDPIVAGPMLVGHTDSVIDAEFSPDGATVVTAALDGTIRLWSAGDGTELAELTSSRLEPFVGFTGRVAFSRDGTMVAGAQAQRTLIWNATTGEELHSLSAVREDRAFSLGRAFSPDGAVLATADNTGLGESPITLWDVDSGSMLTQLDGHSGVVTDVVFSPGGERLYSSSEDGTVRIWDLTSGETLATFTGHSSGVSGIDLSSDGSWIASAGTSTLVWGVDDLVVRAVLPGHAGRMESVDIAPDDASLITGTASGVATWWNLAPDWRHEYVTIAPPTMTRLDAFVGDVEFLADGTLLKSVGTHVAGIDLDGGVEVARFDWTDVSSLSVAPAGDLVVVAGESGLAVHQLASGRRVVDLVDDTAAAGGEFHPDGSRVVGFGPGAFLDRIDRDDRTSLASPFSWTFDATFRPDGDVLALSRTLDAARSGESALARGVVEIIDMATLDVLASIETGEGSDHHRHQVVDLEFDSEGGLLATASWDGTAILWDGRTFEPLVQLRGHAGDLTSVTFDPTGERIATASEDGTIRIWDIDTGTALVTLAGSERTDDIAYSSDGRYLAAITDRGVVTIYLMHLDDLIAAAEDRVTRSLTTAECRQFLHTDDCP